MSFGIPEHPDDRSSGHFVGTHHPRAAALLDRFERAGHVVDLDVEGNVSRISRVGASSDASADSVTRVGLHRHVIVGPHALADLPAERVTVERTQQLGVFAKNLKMDDWISHLRTSSLLGAAELGPAHELHSSP